MSRVQWPEGVYPYEMVDRLAPGDYAKHWKNDMWMLRAPNGEIGTITPETHHVTEHEDGSITVEPSLAYRHPADDPTAFSVLVFGIGGWHGWLKQGLWSGA